MRLTQLWDRAFLEERSSLSLSLFRLAAAWTVGAHVIPTLLQLQDNYLSTAFKTKNPSFFTINALIWVEKSPDWLVYAFAFFFLLTWLFFFAGLFSRTSCVLMVICCYYFYALNSLHIGTLSWDILLVTLFLMCLTPWHGDYFSLDALRRADPKAYGKKRPYFIQRLLQLQIASTFFYTALNKFTAQGNWLRENPYYYLMNSTPESVVKHFPLRGYLAQRPDLCYGLGIACILFEISLPFWLFWGRTRLWAILLGCAFHAMLLFTLHVPTIFFFLFPAQLLLFIDPEKILAWVERKRAENQERKGGFLFYDGQCLFCQGSLRRLLAMDLLSWIKPVNYHELENLRVYHPDLEKEACHREIHWLDQNGRIYKGFFAFRRLALRLPMLWVLLPILHLPGMGRLGPKMYGWIADNRYFFLWNAKGAMK